MHNFVCCTYCEITILSGHILLHSIYFLPWVELKCSTAGINFLEFLMFCNYGELNHIRVGRDKIFSITQINRTQELMT